MNPKEKELYDPPEWVKLVNRIIRGEKTLEDEKSVIGGNSYAYKQK